MIPKNSVQHSLSVRHNSPTAWHRFSNTAAEASVLRVGIAATKKRKLRENCIAAAG